MGRSYRQDDKLEWSNVITDICRAPQELPINLILWKMLTLANKPNPETAGYISTRHEELTWLELNKNMIYEYW